MSGGSQYLDRITLELRNIDTGSTIPVFIDVFNNSLAKKWLKALEHLVQNNYHLEKNYCFFGFENTKRDLDYLCTQINFSIFHINSANIGYKINDHFTPDNCVLPGPVGRGLPGLKINHDKFNQLHRYFEDLQGVSRHLSEYYLKANSEVRWHIRQLNLLCHEAECLILSMRKAAYDPDWRRPSQLMCWLSAPRFMLDEFDLEHFGLDALNKPFGGVFLGVNKAIGKHHWEVFHDEGSDSRIDELTTTTLNSQTEAAGDFDIEWGRNTKGMRFFEEEVEEFRSWLIANGFDPEDKTLTIGHPQVAQVDLESTFQTDDVDVIWQILSSHQDVSSIKISDTMTKYDYHWSDSDYKDRQVQIIGK